MGVLELTQIKRKLQAEYKDIIEYVSEEESEQKYSNFLTRALAAYSIKVLYPNEENENIVKYIVDGSGDNGLDVIYYIKETNELCFVQSKFNHAGNSEPELAEIKKFLDGIRDLLQLKFKKFNKKVNDKKDEIIDILSKEGLRYKAILVYTATNLSELALTEFKEFKDEQNNANDIADFEIINQKRLYSSLSNSISKVNLSFAIKEWGKYENTVKSFYGHMCAAEIFTWWEDYGDSLFDLNIRKMLGNTKINEEIKDTLDINPEKFWYFNNGITIICDSLEKKALYGNSRDIGIFDCKGISIVNGAQTICAIGKFGQSNNDNKEKLGEVYVPVRVIPIERVNEEGELYRDDLFAKEITKTNNRQNQIEDRDFLVLDPEQRRIESQLQVENIKYYLKREEQEIITEKSLTVKEATRALAFAKDIDSTILVRTNIGLIHSDITHGRYKKLFNPSISGVYLWNCVNIQRTIEKCIEILNKSIIIDEETAMLIYSKEIISKIIFDIIGIDNINKATIISNEGLESYNIYDKVVNVLDKIKQVLENNTKSIANIFKSHTDMKDIYNKVTELLEVEKSYDKNKEFDVYDMDIFNYDEKKKLSAFIDKIQGDKSAFEFFKFWIKDKYKKEKYNFGYKSNLHFYINDSEINKATEKFIFRMAYYTKMIISFEVSIFEKYQSVLLDRPELKELIENNTDNKNRIIIDSNQNLEKAVNLFNELF